MPDQASLSHPPKDELNALLEPLLALDPVEAGLTNGLDPSLPSLDDTLQWEPDGTPSWWPQKRQGQSWSPKERRFVLLRNLKERLPQNFPPKPRTLPEKQVLANTLRLTHGALIFGASGILDLS